MDDRARYPFDADGELIVEIDDDDQIIGTVNRVTAPLDVIEGVAAAMPHGAGAGLLAACAQARDDFGVPRGRHCL